jgi:hypothetical protein
LYLYSTEYSHLLSLEFYIIRQATCPANKMNSWFTLTVQYILSHVWWKKSWYMIPISFFHAITLQKPQFQSIPFYVMFIFMVVLTYTLQLHVRYKYTYTAFKTIPYRYLLFFLVALKYFSDDPELSKMCLWFRKSSCFLRLLYTCA